MAQIKVKCRRCGKEVSSTEVSLDHKYKLMVCSACVKESKGSASKDSSVLKVRNEPLRPVASWPVKKMVVKKEGQVCPKCRYRFTDKRYVKCPFCKASM